MYDDENILENDFYHGPADSNDISYLTGCIDAVALEMGAPPEPTLSETFQISCGHTGAVKAEAVVHFRRGIGRIENLYVTPAHRRAGNGRAVLGLIEEFACANNIRALEAETTTFECSELYAHCGFKETTRLPTNVRLNGAEQHSVRFVRLLS